MGKNHFVLYPNAENLAIYETVVKTGKGYTNTEQPFDFTGNTEPGITYWDWSLLPVKDDKAQVTGLLCAFSDVTSRMLAQLALTESDRRFRAAFNQTFQHSALLDPDGNILIANQTALDFTGVAAEDIQGKPLWMTAWWDSRPEDILQIQAAIQQAAGGTMARCENRARSITGDLAIMDITLKPLLDENCRTILLIYEARDITRRVHAEKALQHNEAEIKRMYQSEMVAHHLAETLRSAGLDLSRSLNSGTVFETLLDQLARVVAYRSAHILKFDDEDHLVVQMARGEEGWEAPERLLGKRFEVNDLPLLQPLFAESQPISLSDTALHPDSTLFPNPMSVRSWLATPLLAGDQVIGVCLLEHTQRDFFTEDLIHWAHALTSQAVVAIQNAWLFEQVRDGREHLQALSRRLVESQEYERHFIASELHDDAGQALASLMFGLRLLELDSNDPTTVIAHCQELKRSLMVFWRISIAWPLICVLLHSTTLDWSPRCASTPKRSAISTE